MIVVRLMGGLGNQMFQYALGKALSLEKGEKVLYDCSNYQNKHILANEEKIGINRRLALHHFNINLDEEPIQSSAKRYWRWGLNNMNNRLSPSILKIAYNIAKIINKVFFNEYYFDEFYPKQEYTYRPEIWNIKADNIYLAGYWQTEKYFVKYRDEILHDFQIRTPQSKENKVWSDRIRNCNSVSLHVRRGDYPPELILESSYYSRAIEYISKHVDNPVFFIFSDDVEWVKNNLAIPYEVHYMEQNNQANAYEDMRLMSQCKHNIIANSSFSWWGAWLNQNPNNITIAPNRWISGHNIEDIIPKRWIQL